jgi:hypothetical protein
LEHVVGVFVGEDGAGQPGCVRLPHGESHGGVQVIINYFYNKKINILL